MPVRDPSGLVIQQRDDFIKPDTDMQKLGALKASFAQMGGFGFDDMALAKYPKVQSINHVHTPTTARGLLMGHRQLLSVRRRRARIWGWSRASGSSPRP